MDEALDEQDINIAVTVTVHGRTIDFMNREFTKTFYDALEQSNRGMLFDSIKQFLEQDVYQGITTKLNRKVPYVISERSSNGQQQNRKDRGQPIPPYKGEDEHPEISLHEWPRSDDCLKANGNNVG